MDGVAPRADSRQGYDDRVAAGQVDRKGQPYYTRRSSQG